MKMYKSVHKINYYYYNVGDETQTEFHLFLYFVINSLSIFNPLIIRQLSFF